MHTHFKRRAIISASGLSVWLIKWNLPKGDLSLFYYARKAKIMKDKNKFFVDFLRPAQEDPSQTFLKWADASSIFEKGQKSRKGNYMLVSIRQSVSKFFFFFNKFYFVFK